MHCLMKRFWILPALLACVNTLAQFNSPVTDLLKSYKPEPPVVIWQSSKNENQKIGNKSPIDTTAIKKWVSLEKGKLAICENGNYFVYSIHNQPFGSNTLIIQSTNGSWKKELPGIKGGLFSVDSRQFIFLSHDTLFFVILGTAGQKIISNIDRFETPPSGVGKWLFYQLKNSRQELVILNLATGKEQRFNNVSNYVFDEQVELLLLKKVDHQNVSDMTSLELVNMSNGIVKPVWSSGQGQRLLNYTLDGTHKQLAFLVSDTARELAKLNYSIWYFKWGMDKPVMALNNNTAGIDNGLTLTTGSLYVFTKNGKYLCVYLIKEIERPLPEPNAVQVDIWSYHDSILQSTQLKEMSEEDHTISYPATFCIENINTSSEKRVILLQQDGEEPYMGENEISGDYFITKKQYRGDRFWEQYVDYWLVSLRDGSHKLIYHSMQSQQWSPSFWFSPGGRYLIHFNDDQQYDSYDLQTGKKQTISNKAPGPWNLESPHLQEHNLPTPRGIAGWIGNNDFVLVYDGYDIWRLHIAGKLPPVNITQGYGVRKKLKIRLVKENTVWSQGDTVLLSAFNSYNKENGLFQVVLGNKSKFDEPILGPWCLYFNTDLNQAATASFDGNSILEPVKAMHANTWIVLRQTATEFPNYFVTHNFKTYEQITHLQFTEYNWLTAELLQWQLPDGKYGQGILYKPENFDSKKKYPLIIYYYEWFSGRLHQYPVPQLTSSTHINIPWFVSQGYLVFTPDMYYTNGKRVQSICNTIFSTAQSLSLLPYVDGEKMGISSFSWGGVETNILVSQSNMFAAVATGGAGMGADPVSCAFQLEENGKKIAGSFMEYVEGIMGGTLWEYRDIWLNSSPVLRADQISSPVLMMNNLSEGWRRWQGNVELFMAMRRLNKKVWMLQYDNGSHGVWGPDGQDAKDFTIRLTQFFDHFLKGQSPPLWMSRGIPARLKGIEKGYEIDTTYSLP